MRERTVIVPVEVGVCRRLVCPASREQHRSRGTPAAVPVPAIAPEPVAALAAAPARREIEGHAPDASTGFALYLSQLRQLRESGVVTDAEFLAKKTELLARYYC